MAAFSYWNRGTSVYSATADLYRATFDELLISLWRRYWYRSNGAVHTCTGTCVDANVFVTERNSAFSLFQFIVVALDRWPPLETGATARLSTFDRFEFSSRTLCSQLVSFTLKIRYMGSLNFVQLMRDLAQEEAIAIIALKKFYYMFYGK